MPTHSSETQLATLHSVSMATGKLDSVADPELQKAWHLLSILLSLGHPASPFDLAIRCTLFRATVDLIRSLCSIPFSPITLTDGDDNCSFVTISPRGFFALQQFLSNINWIDAFVTRFGATVRGSGTSFENFRMLYFTKKRKRILGDPVELNDNHLSVSPSSKRIRNECPKPNLFIEATTSELIGKPENGKQVEDEVNENRVVEWREQNRITVSELGEESALPLIISDTEDVSEVKEEQEDLLRRTIIDATFGNEDFKQTNISKLLCARATDARKAEADCPTQTVGVKCMEEELLVDSSSSKKEAEDNRLQLIDHTLSGMPRECKYDKMDELTPLVEEQGASPDKNQEITPAIRLSAARKHLSRPSAKMKLTFGDLTSPNQGAVHCFLEGRKAVTTHKENWQVERNIVATGITEMPKQKHDNMQIKEGRNDITPVSHIDQVESNALPSFESYVVEEEEGSGGYGIVYRARRKTDGATVAIKCPHAKAHRHHVINEQRMLERFGGKNFVIKYEGCLKNGSSDCFVLEHVEHDRPEVLKREINIFELRWYGYCMFKALASLHKQGIVHRDVKPGNFLFSRKGNKGYLIDFNLAMDLNQKYASINKSRKMNDVSFNHATLCNSKYVFHTNSRKTSSAKSFNAINQEATKSLKAKIEVENQGKRAVKRSKTPNELTGWKIMKSQGPDGSGITSAKDMTSTTEKLREPIPCQGRKELINLLRETMHSPNYEASSIPASMRKRIAAPQGKVDEKRIYLTPMPLHSAGNSPPGACLIKNKDGMQKKEGPCVGTKGFRAPEVLLKSPHQGPKVDIWSAGVTLLYLMIGRTPFYGDPEQNIKDIAKLRGSEDLWEVSKLHDREASFPPELYKSEFLPSVNLYEWCKINSKRPNFIDLIPSSLVDLVDKCLTVNPRLRISAKDALRHDFFAPCHEDLRKHRLHRQGSSINSGPNPPLRGKSIAKVAVNQQT